MKNKVLSKRARRERMRIIKAVSRKDRTAYRLYVYSCRVIEAIDAVIARGLRPDKLSEMKKGQQTLTVFNRHLRAAVGRRIFRNFQIRYLLTKSARC